MDHTIINNEKPGDYSVYFIENEFDLVAAKTISKEFHNTGKPCIIIFNNVKYINKETRLFFFTKITNCFPAIAMIVPDKKFEIFIQTALSFFKTNTPIEIYNNMRDAEEWLNNLHPSLIIFPCANSYKNKNN